MDPAPASGCFKSTEIRQKINPIALASSLLCNTESWRKDPQASPSLWLLERPEQFTSTEVTEGGNMVTTSWIFSHATEADNLVAEGMLTNATKKVFIVLIYRSFSTHN